VTSDQVLPGLELLEDPLRLREHLSRTLGRDRERVLDACFSVRRLVPGKRCIVDLDVTVADGDNLSTGHRRLVGKLYNREQGAAVFAILQRLHRGSFGTGRWLVPEPIAYDPVWRLLLLRWSEGALLRSLLLAGADVRQPVRAAAEWLARLHGSGVTSGRCYSFSRHLHTLAGWKRRVADVYPQAEGLLSDLLRLMEDRGAVLVERRGAWTAGPTHRDFSPDHLVIDGDRVTVLDFDEFCQYDSLFDVAHFAAHIRFLGLTSGGSMPYFDAAADLFETEYRARVSGYCEARVALWRAVSYFKLAYIAAVVQRPPGSKQVADSLLLQALQQLSGEEK